MAETKKQDARPKSKVMWALLHVPSGTWDHGYANETLYWSEREAALACRNRVYGYEPIRVRVIIDRESSHV
jgi:hypothetical protein